jgi:hypothetical protein
LLTRTARSGNRAVRFAVITEQTVLFDWEESFAAGAEVCGGKGYNLGRLHR